jgi:hypothetical protein
MKSAFVLFPSLLLAGCITAGEHFRKDSLERASFEMNCPKDQIQVQELNGSRLMVGSQVGTSGCGHRVVYVMSASAGWLANSASRNESTQANK